MDYKAVKQAVCVNETVFSKNAEVPFEFDFTLPDYCPDIVKILKCRVMPRISSKCINGNDVNVEGNICVNVMYCDEKGCIYSYEQTSPFSKTFVCETEIPNGFVTACVLNEYAACRAITERRVDIHGAVNLKAKVTVRKSHDVVCHIDDCNIQTKRKDIHSTTSIGLAEKCLLIEEEVPSGESEAIDCVLQYYATPLVTEIKPMKEKVIVKGDLAVTVMYCTKSHSKYHTFKTVLPFSQFIDIDGVNEDCRLEANADLSFFEVRLKKGDDECKTLLINAKVCVTAKAFCELTLPVICDIYSTKEELEVEKEEVCLERLVDTVKDSYMLKTVFDFPKDSIFDIINYRAETSVKSCQLKGGKIVADATLVLSIICLDGQKKTLYFEKTCDFTWEYPYNSHTSDMVCDCKFYSVSSSYTILSDSSIEFRSEFKVTASVNSKNKMPLIVTVTSPKEKKEKKTLNCQAVIYYANKGESLWNIAKNHNSNIEELKLLNEIEEDDIKENKPLIIPIC